MVKSLYGGGTAISKQDWGSLGANLTTFVGKGLVWASKQKGKIKDALDNLKDLQKTSPETKQLPTPTYIIDITAIAVFFVDFLNGFGTPESGSSLKTAADKWDLYTQELELGCVPHPSDWSGEAAAAYAAQNALLAGFAKTLKGYDKELKALVTSQGDAVAKAHLIIAIISAVLTAAQGIAQALYMIQPPGVGIKVSIVFQITAALAATGTVMAYESIAIDNSRTVAEQLDSLGGKYEALGKQVEAKLDGSFGEKIQGSVAPESTSNLSAFRGISDGLTPYSFAPSLSDLINGAGDEVSPPQRALLEAATEEKEPALQELGAQEETPPVAPAPAAPGVPFTPPSLAQVQQMSNQISQLSQPANSLNQTLNQGVSQIQQLAQSAKGQAGAPPAPADTVDDVEKVDDVKDAETGAAAGGEGTERAPIDAGSGGAAPAGTGRERVV